jgi:hypothetical protein
MAEKDRIVKSMAERIRSEYRKHHVSLDWAHIAALKIYGTHFAEKPHEWVTYMLFGVIGMAVGVVTVFFIK